MSKRYHLFQGYGIELEYMIVNQQTLRVMPISDRLLEDVLGVIDNDYINGKISWSNELVLHVIELKTTLPEADLASLNNLFHENIISINKMLKKYEAILLPTAMHPFMKPEEETKLWPHDYNAVYELYNRIFNCKGHGWSNVQSMHINLPFYDDEEFSHLHDAIRLILPLIPALAASSPIVEGKPGAYLDQRLGFYKKNQQAIPVIAGHIIPEVVHSKRQYHQQIYNEIHKAIAPFDTDQILDPVWVNSRGAIARFDRGSIEIRLIDIQECPIADLAIAAFLIEIIKWLKGRKSLDHHLKAAQLTKTLNKTIQSTQKAEIDDLDYLRCFGIDEKILAGDLLKYLYEKVKLQIPMLYHAPIEVILDQGTLADRIMAALGAEPKPEEIQKLYFRISESLANNKMLLKEATFA